MTRASYDVPKIQTQTNSSKKVQLYCYIVARVYLHAHLAFQAPTASSELEIVLSELWLQLVYILIKGTYNGVIKVWTPSLCDEEK